MSIALARLRGSAPLRRVEIDPAGRVQLDGQWRAGAEIAWDVPTSGGVYGTLHNFRGALEALGNAIHEPPYVAPPKAPVLYVKPANTWIGYGSAIPVPAGVPALRMGGTVGIVIGRAASRVSEAQALSFIGGYTVVNDVSVPHDNFYRPAIREKCRDGFCPIGPWVLAAEHVKDPAALTVRTLVNGKLQLEKSLGELVRSIPRLIADVTAFMTLAEGDVLLPAVSETGPLASAGDTVAIEVAGVGRLENPLVNQAEVIAGELR
ncbi:MAG TPA: fumarylacetoacetate hydrolase family protein [Povalibacter sp.]|nr:fumarylacetoacetate hydrolase family protein [Povalibacter sp.]